MNQRNFLLFASVVSLGYISYMIHKEYKEKKKVNELKKVANVLSTRLIFK